MHWLNVTVHADVGVALPEQWTLFVRVASLQAVNQVASYSHQR